MARKNKKPDESRESKELADVIKELTEQIGDDPERLQQMIEALKKLRPNSRPMGPWDSDNPFRHESH